jgi:drug/metabolite transporter (DMT)-like permease
MTIALALLSAALFGAGVALQQRPASEVPDRYAGRLGLLARVARRPAWVVGVIAEFAGFALQVAALRRGSLVVVQPLITTSLIFTIALVSSWSRERVSPAEWTAVVAVVVGLAGFLVIATPSERSSGVTTRTDWLLFAVPLFATVALLVPMGLRGPLRRRAVILGLAAGLGDGFMAVLTKAFAHSTERGVGPTLTSWVPYALCGAGIVSLVLTQSAYQIGRPKISLPLITVVEPLVSCGIGVALFGEALHLGGARGPFVIVAVVIMAAGLAVLSRSTKAESGEPVASR